jgi:hypothetical protein
MRIASRVLGIVLAMAGAALLALSVFVVAGGFDRRSVLVESGPDRNVWIAGSVPLAFGVVLILAGRYFFRLDLMRSMKRGAGLLRGLRLTCWLTFLS